MVTIYRNWIHKTPAADHMNWILDKTKNCNKDTNDNAVQLKKYMQNIKNVPGKVNNSHINLSTPLPIVCVCVCVCLHEPMQK